MISWLGIGLQNSFSQEGKSIVHILDLNFMFLLFILSVVGFLMLSLTASPFLERKTKERSNLETVWTLLPGILLVFLGFPRIKLLYELEIKPLYLLRLKVIGHQWYWTYNFNNFSLTFDRFLKPQRDLLPGELRLLETDNHLVLPITKSRVIVLSEDVLHRWAVPRLGVKIDANPGRINTFFISSIFPGLFYGQCSEICGANHSFIPITLEIVTPNSFKTWVKTFA